MISLLFIGYILGGALALGILYLFYFHWNQLHQRPGEAKILPAWIPLIEHTIKFSMSPLPFFRECEKKTSEIFGIILGGFRTFVITDPKSSFVVLQTNKNLSVKEFFDMVGINGFGIPDHLVRSPTHNDDQLRKLYTPYLLSDKALHELVGRMSRKFGSLYQWKILPKLNSPSDKGNDNSFMKAIPLFEVLGNFIFNVAVATLFEDSMNDTEAKGDELFNHFKVFDSIFPLCVSGIPIDYFKYVSAPGYTSLKWLNKKIRNIANPSQLMEKRGELFRSWIEKDPRFKNLPEAFNTSTLWASAGNSVPAAFWMLFHIAKHPEYIEVVRREIKETIPNYHIFLAENFLSKDGKEVKFPSEEELKELITMDQINQLFFIDGCFNEAIRLTSGTPIMRLINEEGYEITLNSGNKYKFRKHDRICCSTLLFHHNPELFENPEEFNPYRWCVGETLEEKFAAANGKIPMTYRGEEIMS
jgi:hypothetical protein